MLEINGDTTAGFEIVREANLERNDELGAAVAVYLHGRKVVDPWGGTADPEQSRMWEREPPGRAARDRPPDLAAEAIAWEPMVTALAAQRPFWEPGTERGYHGLTSGWLVGEVVRRVSGRSLGTFLATEIAAPLGLDLWIGLPMSEQHRVSRIITSVPGFEAMSLIDSDVLPEAVRDVMAAYADPTSLTVRSLRAVTPALDHDNPDEQRAEMPSTNGICTARAPARFYAALIGEVDGHRILEPAVPAAATAQRASGVDRILRIPVRIGTGLGLPTPDTFWYSQSAFGFPGLGGSLGFADPTTGLAFGYVMNHIKEGAEDVRAAVLVDAVRTAMKGI